MNSNSGNDYSFDDSDFAVKALKPFAQWINPQNRGSGLSIKIDQAELAKFKPDKNWLKNTVTLKGDKGKESVEVFSSYSPRLLFLNGMDIISNEDKNQPRPRYMSRYGENGYEVLPLEYKRAEKEGWDRWQYFLFFPVGEDNQLLSEVPFRLKVTKACILSLLDKYKLFAENFCSVFQEVTGKKFPTGQDVTCKFMTRAIYQPIITEGEVTNKSGASSDAFLVTDYKKVTAENFSSYCLKNNDPAFKKALDTLSLLKEYVTIPKEVKEPEVIPDENGEIHDPKILAELDNIPF